MAIDGTQVRARAATTSLEQIEPAVPINEYTWITVGTRLWIAVDAYPSQDDRHGPKHQTPSKI